MSSVNSWSQDLNPSVLIPKNRLFSRHHATPHIVSVKCHQRRFNVEDDVLNSLEDFSDGVLSAGRVGSTVRKSKKLGGWEEPGTAGNDRSPGGPVRGECTKE